jgi:hypothetical protein
MAFSLNSLRQSIATSIFGSRLGLDSNDFVVGPKGHRVQIEDLSTTAVTVANHGMSRVITSGSSQGPTQHTIGLPVVGGFKYLSVTSTSTGSAQFLSSGCSILAASDGTTKAVVNLLGQGGVVTLFGITTAAWQVISSVSTGGVSYTTST